MPAHSGRNDSALLDAVGRGLRGGLDANAAGDGADFDATAGSADMGAKRMLVLVFDDDRNIGANFSGDGFGGEMETGVFWNGNFDAAGCGFEMPIGVAGGIAGDFNSTGSAAGLDVVIGADDGDGAAGGFGFDSAAGCGDIEGTRNRMSAQIALNGIDIDAAACGGDACVVAKIAGVNGAAGGPDGDGAVDAVNANAAGGRIEINGPSDVLNFLGAACGGNAEFGFTRDFNGVGDGSVAKTVHGFADANDACVLFDGRRTDDLLQFVFGAAKERAGAYVAVNVDFVVGGALDADGAGGGGEFEAKRAGDVESAVERAVFGGTEAAGGERGRRGEKSR